MCFTEPTFLRASELEEGGRRKQGRPELKLSNSMKRDLVKAGVNSRNGRKEGGKEFMVWHPQIYQKNHM